MKNLIKKSLFTLAIVCFGFTAFSQIKTQTVTKGSTHTYSVADGGLTYTWAVTGGTASTMGKTFTQDITWDTEGVFDLTVYGEDGNGCLSETRLVKVTVVGAGNVMFADASDNDNNVTCSLLAADTPTTTEFDIVFSAGLAPYELTYDVEDKDGNTNRLTKSFPANTGTLSVSDWENTTGGQQTHTITLISATTADGQNIPVDSGDALNLTGVKNNIRTMKVHAKPTISGEISF
jgi:hypothetical protein